MRSRQSSCLGIVVLHLFSALPLARSTAPEVSPAGGGGECRSVQSSILGHAVAFCVLLPPNYANQPARRYPVLYFLHGLGDNEQMFFHSGAIDLVEDLRASGKIGDFIIITPAAGASFYINSREGRNRYEDFFLQEFMPAIERRYRLLPGRGSRGIAGVSMGGYGALRMAFVHPDLFGSVSAHSPALMERLPDIAVGNAPGVASFRVLGDVFGSPPDRAFWDRNNPITLARSANLRGLKVYFDCGAQDDYGFDAGARALDRELSSRGIPHEFHLYPGGHDWPYFASHLPASLEFESKALVGGSQGAQLPADRQP